MDRWLTRQKQAIINCQPRGGWSLQTRLIIILLLRPRSLVNCKKITLSCSWLFSGWWSRAELLLNIVGWYTTNFLQKITITLQVAKHTCDRRGPHWQGWESACQWTSGLSGSYSTSINLQLDRRMAVFCNSLDWEPWATWLCRGWRHCPQWSHWAGNCCCELWTRSGGALSNSSISSGWLSVTSSPSAIVA